jgi:hypothetical protein
MAMLSTLLGCMYYVAAYSESKWMAAKLVARVKCENEHDETGNGQDIDLSSKRHHTEILGGSKKRDDLSVQGVFCHVSYDML